MKNPGWVCLLFLLTSCLPESNTGEWDGSYIGYYHHNQQDTTPVKLVFSGKYFAAAPHYATDGAEAEGVFQQQQSTLVFHNVRSHTFFLLEGAYHYQFGPDGSVRLWQEKDKDFREIILRQE